MKEWHLYCFDDKRTGESRRAFSRSFRFHSFEKGTLRRFPPNRWKKHQDFCRSSLEVSSERTTRPDSSSVTTSQSRSMSSRLWLARTMTFPRARRQSSGAYASLSARLKTAADDPGKGSPREMLPLLLGAPSCVPERGSGHPAAWYGQKAAWKQATAPRVRQESFARQCGREAFPTW